MLTDTTDKWCNFGIYPQTFQIAAIWSFYLTILFKQNFPNKDIIATIIGIVSVLIDKVYIVGDTIGIYHLGYFGTGEKLWQLIYLCAGIEGCKNCLNVSCFDNTILFHKFLGFFWYDKYFFLNFMTDKSNVDSRINIL